MSTKGVPTVAHILQAFVQKKKDFLPNGEAAVMKGRSVPCRSIVTCDLGGSRQVYRGVIDHYFQTPKASVVFSFEAGRVLVGE